MPKYRPGPHSKKIPRKDRVRARYADQFNLGMTEARSAAQLHHTRLTEKHGQPTPTPQTPQVFEARLPTRVDDAIERVQSLAKVCRVPGLLSHVWGTRGDAADGVVNTGVPANAYEKDSAPDRYARQHLAELFDHCAPFFVDSRLLELIEASAPTLPGHTKLHPRHFKTQYGCLLFDRPVRGMPPRRLYTEPSRPDLPMFEEAPMSGFAWQTDATGVVLVMIYSWGVQPGPRRFHGADVTNIPLSVAPWSYADTTLETYIKWHNDRIAAGHGGEIVGQEGDTNNPTRFVMATRIAVATLMLMDQTLTVIQTHPVDRAARKRAERDGWKHEPTVQVVTLRKVENIRVYDADPVQVDWKWRWVVAEHWRTLHRGTPDERTVLVHSYMKGPEGKPIKPVKPKVFAVTR